MMSSRMAWRAAASPSFPFLAAVLPVLVPFLAGWKASCSSARAADTNSWGRCLRQRRRRWAHRACWRGWDACTECTRQGVNRLPGVGQAVTLGVLRQCLFGATIVGAERI